MPKRRTTENRNKSIKLPKLCEIPEENPEKPGLLKEISADEKEFQSQIVFKLTQTINQLDHNKITKENIWSNEAIDLLESFVRNQPKLDYRFLSQCLSAVTKIYTLRVDSLYDDTYRLCKSLGRANFENSKKQNSANDSDTELPGVLQKISKRKAKRKETLTKNHESLNSKLKTNIAIDPFFGKLNSFVGETMRSNRMLMNLLPSKRNGNLGLSLNAPFWDASDRNEWIEEKRQVSTDHIVVWPSKIDITTSLIRPSIAEYRITDEPYEKYKVTTFIDLTTTDEECLEPKAKILIEEKSSETGNDLVRQFSQDSGYLTIREMSFQDSSYHDDNFNHPNELIEKNNLIENRVTVDDMEPETSEHFEYTYRSAALIQNYEAGPSHWKFLSQKQNVTKKIITRRKMSDEVTFRDVKQFDINNNSCLITNVNAGRRVKLLRRNTKMPFFYDVSPELFLKFANSDVDFKDPISFEVNEKPLEELEDNELDHYNPSSEINNNNLTSTFDIFHGMPGLHSISSKRSRIFDIKKIKELTLTVIQTEKEYGTFEIKFSTISSKVCKMFENNLESSSCALVLLSILQSASEKKIKLKHEETKSSMDFLISI